MYFLPTLYRNHYNSISTRHEDSLCGVMVTDYDIIVGEFEFQFHYDAHFRTNALGKGKALLIPLPSYGLIVSLLVILQTGAVIESARAHRLSSISEDVSRLVRAGRMTCKVRRDLKIITDELSRVSRQFHWWHRTFGDLRFVSQNLYIRKQVKRFWQSWRQLSKQARQRFRGPDPSYSVCYDPSVRHVSTASSHQQAPSPPWGREMKNVTKRTFRVATIVALSE